MKIKNFENLNLALENGDFFKKSEFSSEFKNQAIPDSEYEDAKFLYKILQMRNLSKMNSLYDIQDVIKRYLKIELLL